ncbi:hypothetical protein PQB85_gp43 [Erwinia phage Midgardsormr38]|uniref:Uncharacterized protein n=1 Tax=Erwinia phage Midgardsormr38 TaxID=2663326 RepID=A0A5Q2F4J7_9CAUD|nr:hypothetical protein PQB85_gp43 [Erwinia phage Midgardsormr38]QGF22000.1 hypothetical protein [Erwinia phage Midgardsormr38]
MSELTKCWLQQAIAGIETIRDDMPFGLDEDEQKTLAALKMALTVLHAKEKVVELHKRKSTEVISGQRYSYVLLEDLLPELDAANVKYEVKK